MGMGKRQVLCQRWNQLHHSGRSRRHLLWILSICSTHTNTETHSCNCLCTHMDTHTQNVRVHTHSYTWMYTNSSTIDGKQNHMFLHNHIHGQNHILHRSNTFQGPLVLLLRWKPGSHTELMGTSLPECWGVTPWKFLWGFPWWSSG